MTRIFLIGLTLIWGTVAIWIIEGKRQEKIQRVKKRLQDSIANSVVKGVV